jgi:hypothetical protein
MQRLYQTYSKELAVMYSRARVTLSLIAMVLVACSSRYEPFLRDMRAEFEISGVNEAEAVIYSFAQIHNLAVSPKDRSGMSILTQGKPAFFIFLGSPERDDYFIGVGNVGVGEILFVTLSDSDYRERAELERLFEDLVARLSKLESVSDFVEESKNGNT